jgi:4-amino-4-deoxychorismate lyase
MSLLLESIKITEGKIQNLSYHQDRIDRSRRALFGDVSKIDLSEYIEVPDHALRGVTKCRVVYDKLIRKIEFLNYVPKIVNALKLVDGTHIDYGFKYEDRSKLNLLFNLRGNCDDILMVKNGLVSDTSYCNILFYDGAEWLTPEVPLLAGTQRQHLLDLGKIKTEKITPNDLHNYHKFMLINAMLEFDENRVGDVRRIS